MWVLQNDWMRRMGTAIKLATKLTIKCVSLMGNSPLHELGISMNDERMNIMNGEKERQIAG